MPLHRGTVSRPRLLEKSTQKDNLGDNLFCPHCPVVCNSCGTKLKALELGVSTLILFSLNTIIFHPLAGTRPGVLHGDSQVPFLQCRTFAFRNCGSRQGVPCCNCGLRASLYGCDWTRVRLALRETNLHNCLYCMSRSRTSSVFQMHRLQCLKQKTHASTLGSSLLRVCSP